jgi:hypothetical protein
MHRCFLLAALPSGHAHQHGDPALETEEFLHIGEVPAHHAARMSLGNGENR